MIVDEKIKILAKFFTQSRNENDVYLDKLFSLDDDWKKVYEENRIVLSFSEAKILANEFIISKVMSIEYI